MNETFPIFVRLTYAKHLGCCPEKRFEFSEVEFNISGKAANGTHIVGTVSIFKRGQRVCQITVQYPLEFEEGFMPRALKMFGDIMWYDDEQKRQESLSPAVSAVDCLGNIYMVCF